MVNYFRVQLTTKRSIRSITKICMHDLIDLILKSCIHFCNFELHLDQSYISVTRVWLFDKLNCFIPKISFSSMKWLLHKKQRACQTRTSWGSVLFTKNLQELFTPTFITVNYCWTSNNFHAMLAVIVFLVMIYLLLWYLPYWIKKKTNIISPLEGALGRRVRF